MNIKKIEKAANLAIRKLRESKLKSGFPFMINTSELPSDQFYLEHPNGKINITTIFWKMYDYKIVKELNNEEVKALRKNYKLPEIKI